MNFCLNLIVYLAWLIDILAKLLEFNRIGNHMKGIRVENLCWGSIAKNTEQIIFFILKTLNSFFAH